MYAQGYFTHMFRETLADQRKKKSLKQNNFQTFPA